MQEESFTSAGVVPDTRRGLLSDPKWLSSLYFYDVEGSRLFEEITKTPEYYPTRTEQSILDAHAGEMLDAAGADLLLAEMGSGSSKKTRVIIKALLAKQGPSRYVPIDVSKDFLDDVAADLQRDFPGLDVSPLAAEYGEGLHEVGRMEAATRLVLFLGSSLGNFEPTEQVALLRRAHDALGDGDCMLIGTDLVKDVDILEAAYNDAAGVTAAFNKNILTHLQSRMGGHADPDDFEHLALWNPAAARIEMHLVAKWNTILRFDDADLEVTVKKGERIHTENSYKFTPKGFADIAARAGWTVANTWTDDRQWFAVHLLRR